VKLLTTHASWVFLVGDDVWKVKRPVDFGFLDFRSVEARRRACEEELRLNQRLAPDVYIGVEPIRESPTGYAIGGEGPIADWTVHMQRLPDEASARALLARGALDARALEQIADTLAEFFRNARPTPQFGVRSALLANVEENFAQVQPFTGHLVDRETLEQVRAFQKDQLSRRRSRFMARIAGERIREGHGDLRLDHVYMLPESGGARRVVIIDCIEFNERFRCGDVAADVAFLAMELEAARRPDLAAGFLARFAEASDDFGLYTVLDFYLSYRAWVRGKVAAFLAGDPATSLGARTAERDKAHRLFGLARSFSGTSLDRPFLIAVGGVIGSGKSTLAAALGRELAVPVISSDRVRKAAAGIASTARADASLYDRQSRDRTYAELARHAAGVLGSGRGAILDATFSEPHWRRLAAETARARNADFVFVEATCTDRDRLRQRLAARRQGGSVSDATDQLLEGFLREFQPLSATDPGPRFSVDTGATPGAALGEAMRKLTASGIFPAAARRAS
jgi:aminoglycoside phosphotransferase family enzyme/predicted kinase